MAWRSQFRPHTFHSWDRLAGRFELVLREPIASKDRRFGNGRQSEVVAWTGEVQDTKAVNVLMALGRDGNSVDRAPDMVGGKRVQDITSVGGNHRILGFNPLPLAS